MTITGREIADQVVARLNPHEIAQLKPDGLEINLYPVVLEVIATLERAGILDVRDQVDLW